MVRDIEREKFHKVDDLECYTEGWLAKIWKGGKI